MRRLQEEPGEQAGSLLEPIRERRKEFQRPGVIEEILRQGTRRAVEAGGETMEKVRVSMQIDYLKGAL